MKLHQIKFNRVIMFFYISAILLVLTLGIRQRFDGITVIFLIALIVAFLFVLYIEKIEYEEEAKEIKKYQDDFFNKIEDYQHDFNPNSEKSRKTDS